MISGLGLARKATLAQHGITTAAEVRADRIQALPGFGAVLTTAVLAWRESRVRAFRYNPRDPITARERADVVAPLDARRQEIRVELQGGRDELHHLSSMPSDDRHELARRLAAASQAVRQAELDVSALKRASSVAVPIRLGHPSSSSVQSQASKNFRPGGEATLSRAFGPRVAVGAPRLTTNDGRSREA